MFNTVLEKFSNFELFDTDFVLEYMGIDLDPNSSSDGQLIKDNSRLLSSEDDVEQSTSLLQSIGTFILLGPFIVLCLIFYFTLWFTTKIIQYPLWRKLLFKLNNSLFWNETVRLF
jgi:hypothetical protein